jgi:cation diffusion facilitator family transporter
VRYPPGGEIPDEKLEPLRRAVRLEWFSVGYWVTALVFIYLTLGSSQAMKAAAAEDLLALFPPAAWLIAHRVRDRSPDKRFPWGYHRAITVGYVVASLALFIFGAFILIDSAMKLFQEEHPDIGLVELGDSQIWLGWLMVAALLYSGIPPIFIGLMKRRLAAELHDKLLFADAKMNQADWLTAGAAIAGVIGIGFGWWWADSVAAIAISIDILHDGQKHLRNAVADVMDDMPQTYDEAQPHPVIDKVKDELRSTEWVREGVVRLREHGHVIAGNVWIVPVDGEGLVERVEEMMEKLDSLDWRLQDVTVSPVRSIEDVPPGLEVRTSRSERS